MIQPVNVDFVIAPIEAPPDEVAGTLGIRIHEPHGQQVVHLRRGKPMIEIGKLVECDGQMHIYPKDGATDCHRRHLSAAAEAAFFGTCHAELGWKRSTTTSGRSCWIRWISIPLTVADCARPATDRAANHPRRDQQTLMTP